ncbi:hypothetical protein RB620_23065 [Paenibacillus sp. LHD-117]|uniref:hypothetical protein n=1 Tax=Paenibacillus sp. LHD-117 TaxID=3071412 RepID=UPI0027DF080F|nr:hypothetical protein [Paenibacillus sp. LHD-117]MDQ6422314.1 hypothetical protein [Paenibacillus sp. LHD-117]
MSLYLENSSFPTEQPQHVNISRIELFVIPALAVDATGYRVCLRLTSDLGFGWSEQFICENDASFDLEHWSELLQSFVGRFPLTSITERLTEIIESRGDSDKRVCQMFVAAIHQIRDEGALPSIGPSSAAQAEESVLQQRAIAYLSLD